MKKYEQIYFAGWERGRGRPRLPSPRTTKPKSVRHARTGMAVLRSAGVPVGSTFLFALRYLKSMLVASVFILWMLLGAYAQERPNIIWLMAEDIGPDIECYGMLAVKTPNLNQLAEEGIRYTHCFSTNPICSPNRSAMMVGVHQNKINAHHHRGNRDVPLAEPYKPFTYWLRQAGYTTVLGNPNVMDSGRKIDCNFKNTPLGAWDGRENFGLFDKYDELTVGDQPFFAQVQLKVTHRGDWWEEIRSKSPHPVDLDKVELPSYMADHPVVRLDWATYLDQIEYMDSEVGDLIEDLKEKGLYENTVIIFMGDNGRCNIRGKGYLTDPGIHVPLIVSWPAEIASGQVKDDIISTIDITATILDLAGIDIPASMDGRSFMREDFHREYVYSARDRWDDVLDKSRSLRTQKYKYIRNDMPEVPYDDHQAYLEFHRPAIHIMRKLDIENQLSKEQKIFFSATKPSEELYDLQNDPEELVNLAQNPEYAQVIEKMRADLKREEASHTSRETIYHPQPSVAINILEWVMYKFPEDYLQLLQGVPIGYTKYVKSYNDYRNEVNNH